MHHPLNLFILLFCKKVKKLIGGDMHSHELLLVVRSDVCTCSL